MTLPGRRVVNFAGLLACTGMMGFALYAQHILLLEPCPLCVLQRVAVIGLGVVFLIAALHGPLGFGRYVYMALIAAFTLAGIGVAGWHVRLQHLPPSETPSCGPGLDYLLDNFPLSDALRMVFQGSGECAKIVWQFLGLSMPAWVLIGLLVLGTAGVWNNLRRDL
jgi:protein dithiol:quinone oxidoreductase